MAITYVIENYIDENTLDSVSSEDPSGFYDMERLYNERPSWPLRFEGKGSTGPDAPEWICVNMGEEKEVTFAGIFNHNLTAIPEAFNLKGCVDGCEGSGACAWDDPGGTYAWKEDMLNRIHSGKICDDEYEYIFPNSCKKISRTQWYYRFEFIDTTNPDGHIEIGEAVLGKWCQFGSNVHLQPGRPDGPSFYMGNQETHFGQDWPAYFSYNEEFTLVFKNINDIRNLDELRMFLIRVQKNGGKFIIIPDDDSFFNLNLEDEGYIPLCYYVIIKNLRGYAQRLLHGWDKDLREWTLELKTLTTGLKLKG